MKSVEHRRQFRSRHAGIATVAMALAAALLLLAAAAASAKQTHTFDHSFGEPGSAAGQLQLDELANNGKSSGIAVNDTSGDAYVADTLNHRIDQFSSSGAFIRAWGWGVENGASELQTCTEATGCRAGLSGTSPGEFEAPVGIAVDNSGGPSQGDVYVADRGDDVITKFTGSGILAGGWGVGGQLNGSTATDGPFRALSGLLVDSGGNLEALDTGIYVYRFAQDGTFLADFSVSGGIFPVAFALAPGGNFFNVNSGGEANELDPSGTELGLITIPNQTDVTGLAVDSSTGNLYVANENFYAGAEGSKKPQVYEYAFNGSGEVVEQPSGTCKVEPGAGCEPTSSFGLGEIGSTMGVAVNSSSHVVYAVDAKHQRVLTYKPAVFPDVVTQSPSEVEPTSATLNGTVNPVNAGPATCVFVWGTTTKFGEETPCSATLADGGTPVGVHAELSGLKPDTTYHYRLEATNSQGTNTGEVSQDHEFTTPGPGIHIESVSDVSADSATLQATIDPHGSPSTYHFEYDTIPYAEGAPAHGTSVPLPDQGIGSGEADIEVSRHIQGLLAATVYHYRVVVRSEIASGLFEEFDGPDVTFTTQTPAPFALPDSRQWELVSPPDKLGAALLPISERGTVKAAVGGGAISYLSNGPIEAEPEGYPFKVQVLSVRNAATWQSRDLDPLHEISPGAGDLAGEYRFFSADLSQAVLQPAGAFEPSLSSQASEQTAFLRTDFPAADPAAFCSASCYRPLVTGAEGFANVPPGTEFGEEGKCPEKSICGPYFIGASSDAYHVVLRSIVPLVEGAPAGGQITSSTSLYEWSADEPPAQQLQLISVLPDGSPALPGAGLKLGSRFGSQGEEIARNAISADGSRVVWSEAEGDRHLYLRNSAGEETIQLDAVQGGSGAGEVSPSFEVASADDSRIFFTDSQQLVPGASAESGPDLYECHVVEGEDGLECQLTDLTANHGSGINVLGAVLGASEDGSSVYFVAEQVLASNQVDNGSGVEEAQVGQPNLYLSRAGQTTFIATLAEGDAGFAKGDSAAWTGVLAGSTVRVSPDGRWLAFMSKRPLSGYDNRDAATGEPDQEVYLYHAPAVGEASLVCASCDPTGARPRGVRFESTVHSPIVSRNLSFDTPVAASVPGWTRVQLSMGSRYQPRYLSDGGRLFFNSADALVSADANGTQDIYQYEPPSGGGEEPAGDACTASSPTYGPASQGCVSLVSSGTSTEESAFLDASESGKDVFFLTAGQLSRRDADTSFDVYDARVGGGEAEPVKPVECEGDGCQQPAAPPNDPTPGSLTFHGAGNLEAEPPARCRRGKVKRSGKCPAKKHKVKHKKHRANRQARFDRGGHK